MQSLCAAPTASQRLPDWQGNFLAMLPAIESYAKRAFCRLSAHDREEAVQAVVAYAAVAYARLAQLRKADQGHATPLARFGVKQYCAGRMIGGSVNAWDVGSTSCRRRGCVVQSLDDWKDSLCDSRRATPAEIAALRIDLSDWLKTLSPRDRQVAGALASGEPTGGVAKMFRLTSGRVSQLRRELYDNWRRFVGETVVRSC